MKQITKDDLPDRIAELLRTDPYPPAETSNAGQISERAVSRVRQAELSRQKRELQQQDVGFSSRPFTLCNLPVRPLKNRAVYERHNGNFFLRIEAGQGKELPYGRDRLVLILVATMAVQQQSRVVKLGSATDILRLFGRGPSGTHYRRLMESFDRIFSATIYWGTQGQLGDRRFVEQYKVSILDHLRLWYSDISHTHGTAFENVVTLSQSFFDELMAHPIPVDMEVVRGLLDSPGELDFYIWIVLRTWAIQRGATAEVPLFGPSSLREQLGTSVQANWKFRQMVRNWLKRTKAFWPQCPAAISADGNVLIVTHGKAIHSSTAL
jgi:hypothetical protein